RADRSALRHRRARRGRSHLGHLPAHDRRPPGARPREGPPADGSADRVAQPRRPGGTERGHHPRPDPQAPRRGRAGLLRPTRNQQRTDRGDQRPPRTPTRHRPGLPQPHQLHRPQPPRDRRLQTPTTPSSAMSLIDGLLIVGGAAFTWWLASTGTGVPALVALTLAWVGLVAMGPWLRRRYPRCTWVVAGISARRPGAGALIAAARHVEALAGPGAVV